MSKQLDIMVYLLEGHTLTQERCRKKFNHWRLASVVDRLRKWAHVQTSLIRPTGHALYYVPRSCRDKSLLRKLKEKQKVAR